MAAPPSLSTNERSNPKLDLLFKFIFALIAGTLVLFLKLDYLESYFYDLRVSIKSELGFSNLKSPQIALIYIDSKTIEKFQSYPSYSDHIDFLKIIKTLNPRYIVYDFRIEQKKIVDIAFKSEQEKKEFSKYVTGLSHFYIMTQDLKMKGEESQLSLEPALQDIPLYSGSRPADTNLFAKDGVSRRIVIQYQDQTMLQAQLASYYNPEIQDFSKIRGTFKVLDSLQTYIHFHPKGSFETYSFADIFNEKLKPNYFENKIVIVSTDTGKTARDYAQTPFSRDVTAMTSAELQANQIQTLIDNNAPIKTPKELDIFLTLFISILTVYVTLALKPSKGLLIISSLLFILAGLALVLFIYFGLWINFAHPILSIFLCYYFFIPYRLIIENRRSWEYYQKHLLLSQLEELKTNFISMMSHDLKTPIARILGMTEIILGDAKSLSNSQIEAVDTIRHSSDDLLQFINSILQYGRIESEGVVLNKTSKDVNILLADVIKKHEFLAKVKKIKILSETETLFPMQVDAELIKQVFSNLLENAIKYSPENSTVWVKTSEVENKVRIEFIDQGLGISESDLPNIFMKFFRTHNVKTSTIKGSGLGLYLAQYFTQLHKGDIKVESQVDKGSRFTLELPLEP